MVVSVANVNDAATITMDPTTPQACRQVTGILYDEDGITEAEWSWGTISGGTGEFDPPATTATDTYTPPGSSVGNSLELAVAYSDRVVSGQSVTRTLPAVIANKPGDPSSFRATAGGRTVISLGWGRADDCGATVEYEYRYKASSGTTWTTKTTSSLSARVTGLRPGTGYDFELKVKNSVGNSGTLTATATTHENRSPTVTGPSSVTVDEDSTTVGTYTGTDPEGDRLTWSANATGFSVSPGAGHSGGSTALSFGTAPDYEEGPTTYTVDVTATDPYGASGRKTVAISVRNVDERRTLTISPDPTRVRESFTLTITDPDRGWSERTGLGRL